MGVPIPSKAEQDTSLETHSGSIQYASIKGTKTRRMLNIQPMGAIYEKAQHVLIWLDIAADESNILLRRLDFVQRTKDPKLARSHDVGRRLAARFIRHAEKKKRFRQGSDDEFEAEDMPETLDHSLAKELGPWIEERKEAWIHALICLFGIPYWQRVWIVQECLLEKKSHLFVCCGSQMISWTALKEFDVNLQLTMEACNYTVIQAWMKFSILFEHGGFARAYILGRVVIG
jgi:hypothetical protein